MTAVITGSSKGIGKEIAAKFAAAGYNLQLCARDAEMLKETAEELKSVYPGITVDFKKSDLSVKAEAISFGEWCISLATPAVLVNNAGSYLPGNCFDEPEGNLELLMNTNLYSAYYLSRIIIPAMKKAGTGHIFNICSVASLRAYPGGGSYSISKFALNGLSQNLRQELMNDKIKVTSVFPGAVYTDSWQGFDNSNGRIMEASDIAEMILAATRLNSQANVDEIIIRPVLGDL